MSKDDSVPDPSTTKSNNEKEKTERKDIFKPIDPILKWLDSNRLVRVIGIIFAIFSAFWMIFTEVLPRINPKVNIMTGELNIAVAGFSPQGDEKITKKEN